MKLKALCSFRKWFGLSIPVLLAFVTTSTVQSAEIESSIARGGLIYDKWYKVVGMDAPKESHVSYPADKKYAAKPKSNWRCKECHGWDYMGKDGAYSSGKHHSGIVGINGAIGKSTGDIISLLKSDSHGYGGKLSDADMNDIALFVTKGQINMDKYIDRKTKAPKGDQIKGEVYYNTICAKCHGKDGLQPKEMKPFGAQMGNPWEVMHKILNGQPGEKMPALRALDHQLIADIMAHMTTLPNKR
jgi:cytochrome c553